ncbi:diguanylate cyclase domain-containing protein [Shewanella sp. NIFS-20-20]|uniref:GGDEF domain-containing protein n=1 Tax=Shewanella sp. NIFS-20-20 TaxID=2853806 RepID=UPI001C44DB15|nr:diguanylate cyclase [Shewanella sp. NIFS-20-20]MBV7317142.1 diguanylate cyclase [Shewanella sp. NIFS-20-20]
MLAPIWPMALLLISVIDIALLAATTELRPWQTDSGMTLALILGSLTCWLALLWQCQQLRQHPPIYSWLVLGFSGLYLANLLYAFDLLFVIKLNHYLMYALGFAMIGAMMLWQGITRMIQSLQDHSQLISKISHQDLVSSVAQHAELYQTRKPMQAPKTVVVLVIAIDRFSPIQDKLGAAAAQYVQLSLAQLITENIRQQDWLSPLEPGWMMLYLPNVDSQDAALKAEHIRLLVTEHIIHCSGQPLRVTLTIAHGQLPHEHVNDYLEAARAQIESTKAAGNKVFAIASET